MRQCKDCLTAGVGPKPLTEFHRKAGELHGRDYICKPHKRLRVYRQKEVTRMRYKLKLARRISRETGVPFEHVQTVVNFMRTFPRGEAR